MSKIEVTTATTDQLSGGERKLSRAAVVYDLFDQISLHVDPYGLEGHSRIDKMRDELVLQIVREEADHD